LNGEADHVHLLLELPPNLDLSVFVNNSRPPAPGCCERSVLARALQKVSDAARSVTLATRIMKKRLPRLQKPRTLDRPCCVESEVLRVRDGKPTR
jgi:hypothetical protein